MQVNFPNGLQIVEQKTWTSGISDGSALSLSGFYNLDKHMLLPGSFGNGDYYSAMNLHFSSENEITPYRGGTGASLPSVISVAVARVRRAFRKRASVSLTVASSYHTYDLDMFARVPTSDTSKLIALTHHYGRFFWVTSSASQYVSEWWAEPIINDGNLHLRLHSQGNTSGTTLNLTISAEVGLL